MELDNQYLSGLLETAIVAARLAGQRAMEEISYIKTSLKNGNELVTQADSICQKIIIDRIKENYPDHGFIGEEGKDGKLFKQAPRGDDRIWWVIDPIDGTNNFAHGILLFVVSIAAFYEGNPIAGVIFEPATESMYTGVKDGEAHLNNRRILASEEDMNQFASIGLDSHLSPDEKLPDWAGKIIKETKYRNFGTTALQLAYVAKGSMAATITDTPKLWDIAAGAIIAESAGAMITNWQGEKIFPVDTDNYEGGTFPTLVANEKTHGELVRILNS
ncbi:MAG: inositol monophosphatase family protein [Sedimentisphaerales bacterium]|nr:inositol monophosphatase family protein [Sedimentisphaerales bacterium]